MTEIILHVFVTSEGVPDYDSCRTTADAAWSFAAHKAGSSVSYLMGQGHTVERRYLSSYKK